MMQKWQVKYVKEKNSTINIFHFRQYAKVFIHNFHVYVYNESN